MWHSLFSCPKNILIMYLIPWNKGKSCHMDGPSLMVQQVFGNPTYRLTFRKRRILDHYLRFCNWSGVSGNGFLGLSKYYIYIIIYIYLHLVELTCIIGTLLFPPWGNQLVISCIYVSSTMFMDNHMYIMIFTFSNQLVD